MPDLQISVKRNLVHDTFYKGRLTFTVLTDKSNLLPSLDGHVHLCKHRMFAIVFPYLLADHGIVTATETGREL